MKTMPLYHENVNDIILKLNKFHIFASACFAEVMPPGTLGGPPLKTLHSSVDGERPCEGCGLRINDRYLLSVGESLWHEQCVACAACGVMLTNSCYWRNSKLYCKDDYDRYVFSMKKVPICLKARLAKKGGAPTSILKIPICTLKCAQASRICAAPVLYFAHFA
jgi:hypothetical protein